MLNKDTYCASDGTQFNVFLSFVNELFVLFFNS